MIIPWVDFEKFLFSILNYQLLNLLYFPFENSISQ